MEMGEESLEDSDRDQTSEYAMVLRNIIVYSSCQKEIRKNSGISFVCYINLGVSNISKRGAVEIRGINFKASVSVPLPKSFQCSNICLLLTQRYLLRLKRELTELARSL